MIEPAHDKTYKMACAPGENSDQPGHPPSLIWIFTVRMKKAWVLCYLLSGKRRLWSDCADAQADPSLRWCTYHFVGFVMRWLIYYITVTNERQKMYFQTCAHLRSPIGIFTRHISDSHGCKVSSCGQRRFWSECADAQVDLNLCWLQLSK